MVAGSAFSVISPAKSAIALNEPKVVSLNPEATPPKSGKSASDMFLTDLAKSLKLSTIFSTFRVYKSLSAKSSASLFILS